MQHLIRQKIHPGAAGKVVIIPNWASLDEINASNIASRLSLSPFTVQMAGNMGRGHNVEILIEAARELPHIRFTFVGAGAKKEWLERSVADHNLTNVRVENYRPREQLSASLGDCDVAVIAFVPKMAGVSVPSRLYNVMASGRPVVAICEQESELAAVVQEENIGWIVDPTDLQGLVRALLDAVERRSDLDRMGVKARQAAEMRYSEPTIMRAYDALFEDL
jgi:glycosyltransferase involved in cell wall biosynthesis